VVFVSDSTALIGLARIQRLDILKDVAKQVYIPTAVYKEVVIDGKGKRGAKEVRQADWIKRADVKDTLAVQILCKDLGPGESEAIVLAQEMGTDYVILDEEARDYARRLDLKIIGTIGILLWAKKLAKIVDVKSILDDLIRSGFHISNRIYTKVIAEES
jgi:predicted nucleic acid-binding protein